MNLRYAYNTNGTAWHRLDDALTLIASSGYDGVALTLDHHHLDPNVARLGAKCAELEKARGCAGPRGRHRNRCAFPPRCAPET